MTSYTVTTLDTIASLLALTSPYPAIVDVLGYAAIGDGGGGRLYWNAVSSTPVDNGIVFKPTAVATNGRYFRILKDVIPIEWYGASNGTDISTNLHDALSYSPRKVVRLAAGVSYTLGSTVRLTGTVRIDARGATITQSFNNTGIVATAGWATTGSSVVIICNLTTDVAQGASSVTLSTSDAVNFAPGDTVKIFSDEHQAGSRKDNGTNVYRRGEVAQVVTVNTSTGVITLAAPTTQKYTATSKARVVKYSKAIFELIGGNWRASDGHDADWTSILWQIIGYNAPRLIGVKSDKNYAQGFWIQSCVDALIESPRISNFNNSDVLSQNGYGIVDVSSEGTRVIDARVDKVRHGVTCAQQSTPPGPTDPTMALPENYGPTRYLDADLQGTGMAQGMLDLHEGSQDCTLRLTNCYGPALEVNPGGGVCASARGFRHRLIAPKGRYGRIGVQVWSDSSQMQYASDFSYGIVVQDADISNQTQSALLIENVASAIINGGRYGSDNVPVVDLDGTAIAVFNTTQTIYIDGEMVVTPGQITLANGGSLVNIQDSILVVRGTLVVDATQVNGARATGTITINAQPAPGDNITFTDNYFGKSDTLTFVSSVSDPYRQVQIGSDVAATISNLATYFGTGYPATTFDLSATQYGSVFSLFSTLVYKVVVNQKTLTSSNKVSIGVAAYAARLFRHSGTNASITGPGRIIIYLPADGSITTTFAGVATGQTDFSVDEVVFYNGGPLPLPPAIPTQATLDFSVQVNAGDTLTINSVTATFVNGTAGPGQIAIGTSRAMTAANVSSFVGSYILDVTASSTSTPPAVLLTQNTTTYPNGLYVAASGSYPRFALDGRSTKTRRKATNPRSSPIAFALSMNGQVPHFDGISDDCLTVLIVSSGSYNLGELPAASGPGQLLSLVNAGSSSSFIVKNGASWNTSLSGDQTVLAGKGLLLVADSTLTWTQIAASA